MSRITPYSLGSISPELEQFRDELTNAWNYGKYAVPIISSLPSWRAQPGESIVFAPASGGHTLYMYFNSAWVSTWSITV